MSLNIASRARFLHEFYLIAPFLGVTSGAVVIASNLDDWALKQMPLGLSAYANMAVHFFPVSWLIFTLGCSFGTSLEWAQRVGLQGWKFTIYLICWAIGIFIAQAGICGPLGLAFYASLTFFSRH